MQDHDLYLRHASLHDGDWVGFTLAAHNLTGVPNLPTRPHTRWRPWILDPDTPNDPTTGDWGTWQWRVTLALFPVPTGLLHTPPDPPRTPTEMRDDLLLYIDLPIIQLQDTDGTTYTVKPTAYTEQSIDPEGGWLATLEFAET